MSWKSEISEFYKVKVEDQLFSWKSTNDINNGLECVADALREIETQLTPFVSNIKFSESPPDAEKQSVNLTFEEKFCGKTSFVVTLELNSSYVAITTRHSEKYRTYYLRLDEEQSLNAGVIIDEFMIFFRSTRCVNEE